MQNEFYRVRVHSYARGPRRIVIERKVDLGPYTLVGSLPVPEDDLDEAETRKLEAMVLERLSQPPAHEDEAAKARVEARLRAGLGQAA